MVHLKSSFLIGLKEETWFGNTAWTFLHRHLPEVNENTSGQWWVGRSHTGDPHCLHCPGAANPYLFLPIISERRTTPIVFSHDLPEFCPWKRSVPMEADSHSGEGQSPFKLPFFLLTFSIIYSIMFNHKDKGMLQCWYLGSNCGLILFKRRQTWNWRTNKRIF